MSDLFVLPRAEVQDSSGGVEAGAKLEFFESGTSTNLDTYSDDALTTANANPVIADSAGRFGTIFLRDEDYKVTLSDSDDVQIWSADPVRGGVDNLADDTIRSTLSTTGSANAYALTVNRTITAYTNGDMFVAKANFQNTDAATLNITGGQSGASALGAKTIKKNHNQDVVSGDIENGQWCIWKYDGTNMQLISSTAASQYTDPITTRGDVIRGDSSGNVERVAVGTADQVLVSDGTDIAYDEVPLSRSYLAGLAISNNGTDATNDIDIAVGEARNTDNDGNLALDTALIKQIDSSWVTGTNNGGLSSSLTLTNDTWYHVHLIDVGGTIDVGFDTSVAAANLITDHSALNYRRIGSVRRGTATNLVFVQDGDSFLLDNPPLDIDASNPGTSAVLRTLTVPVGVKVEAVVNAAITDNSAVGTTVVYLSSPDASDEAPSQTVAPLYSLTARTDTAATSGMFYIRTNTSSQVRSRQDSSTADHIFRISTLGWNDRRGRDD